MGRPKHTRRDENHAEVRDGLRELGLIVWDLADVGGEVLDLLACGWGYCVPVEVKPPGKEDDLTDGERGSIEELKRWGIPVVVATSVDDVLAVFEELLGEPN